jgi:hypothetical protein
VVKNNLLASMAAQVCNFQEKAALLSNSFLIMESSKILLSTGKMAGPLSVF